MSSSIAELTLLLNAKNLASSAVASVGAAVDGVAKKAGDARRALGEMGSSLSAGLGNLTENLLTGQDFGQAAVNLGAFLAGETVQEFGTSIVSKFAGSAVVQAIGGALAGLGGSIGSLIAAAIPVGMAAAPVLILAAVGAAILFLVNNPEIVAKIAEVAGSIISGLVNGLATLGGALLGVVGKAWDLVSNATLTVVGTIVGFWLSIPGKLVELGATIVTTIIGGLASLPGKVADIVRDAFANLRIDVGPFHINGRTGVTIDLPDIGGTEKGVGRLPGGAGGHAAGGWAGLNGPELSWLGERGPEFVLSNDMLRDLSRGSGRGGSPVVIALNLDGREVARVVDERLFYALSAAAPTPAGG